MTTEDTLLAPYLCVGWRSGHAAAGCLGKACMLVTLQRCHPPVGGPLLQGEHAYHEIITGLGQAAAPVGVSLHSAHRGGHQALLLMT